MPKTLTDAERLTKMANDRARARWGREGWSRLSIEMREGAIAREVVFIIGNWLHHDDNPAVLLCEAAITSMQEA